PPSDFDTQPEGFAAGLPCFARGTPILTADGERPVEEIRVGDLVMTRDAGLQPVLWHGHRHLTAIDLDRCPDWRPIHFPVGSVGNLRPLRLSPQHAVAIRLPDGTEVLVRARHLAEAGYGGARVARGVRAVTYHHLLLPHHAILSAAGAPAESLYPGPEGLRMLGDPACATLFEALRLDLQPGVGLAPGDILARFGPRVLPLVTGAQFRSARPCSGGAARHPQGQPIRPAPRQNIGQKARHGVIPGPSPQGMPGDGCGSGPSAARVGAGSVDASPR
ncbi:MAG: Hint domain-containing protein, partial [Rhodobacteraceae bacterium]|nr:Hint domain-containing protein [Paracoccaceae bacterium]